jgi:hypothetical protein
MDNHLEVQARLLAELADSTAGIHIFLSCLADELRITNPELMSLVVSRIRQHDNPLREPGRQLSAIQYALSLAGQT